MDVQLLHIALYEFDKTTEVMDLSMNIIVKHKYHMVSIFVQSN